MLHLQGSKVYSLWLRNKSICEFGSLFVWTLSLRYFSFSSFRNLIQWTIRIFLLLAEIIIDLLSSAGSIVWLVLPVLQIIAIA